MGDEMNRASKLGEDTARGNETLVTSNVYFALRNRSDVLFEQLASDDQLFPYLPGVAALRRPRGPGRSRVRTRHCNEKAPLPGEAAGPSY